MPTVFVLGLRHNAAARRSSDVTSCLHDVSHGVATGGCLHPYQK